MHKSHDKEMKVTSRPSQPKIMDGYTNTDSVTFSDNEISQIPVKKEQPLIVSNTTVDDTDIVYDLSDYEENEKFNAMIKKSNRHRICRTIPQRVLSIRNLT